MSVAAFAAFCLIQSLYLDKFTLLTAGYHHLGYALTVVDNKIFSRQIHQNHTDFSPIIGINRSR